MKAVLGFFLAVTTTFAQTAGSATPDSPIKIQLETEGMKPWLDFHNAHPRAAYNLAVHGHPLQFTEDMQILPGYIKSWKWDNSSQKYIFKLDRTLKYHNGESISAYDFEFALIKALITPLPGFEYSFLRSIKGFEKVKRGDKFQSGMVEGVHVTDPETIEVALTGNHTRFLYNLNGDLAPMAPIKQFKDDLYTFKDVPIGCGPYRITFSDPKSSLVRLERVYGNGPKFVDLLQDSTAYKNNSDIAFGPGAAYVSEWLASHPSDYKTDPILYPSSIEILEFNYSLPGVRNINFRRAVEYSINKSKTFAGLAGNRPTEQLISKMSFGYQNIESHYDLKKAKELFATLPKNDRQITYKLLCHGTPGQSIAPYYLFVRDSLRAIGMKVEIELSEEVDFSGNKRNAGMIVWGRLFEADPLITFSDYLPGVKNVKAPEKDPVLRDLFERANRSESVQEKADLIKLMSKHIIENRIVMPLHERYDHYYYKPKIKKVALTPISGYLDISKVELSND